MTRKLIAAAAVIAAIVACTKNEQPESGDTTNEGFRKGQQVTLTFSASYNNQDNAPDTKVTSEWNSTTSAVDFKWEEGDQVKVTVVGYPDDPAVFTLASGAGSSTATFTGKMPADGTQYTVQYPVNDPDITIQAYSSAEAIPHDMMKFIGNGEYSVHAHTETLTAQYAALRLNFYGTDQTVGKIVVTNTTSSIKYTLNCTNAVTLGTTAESATPFYIVVPEGNYKFSAEIFDNAADPASICTFEPSAPQDFKNGYVLNMSGAKEVKKEPSVFLPGYFTVAPGDDLKEGTSDDVKVRFTKGNLYYSSTDGEYHLESEQIVTYATLGQESYDPTHVTLFYWVTPSEATDAATAPWAESFGTHTQTTSDKFFCGKDNPMTVDGQSGLYALTGNSATEGDLNHREYLYICSIRRNCDKLMKPNVTVTTSAGTVNSCLVLAPDNWDFTTYPLQTEYSSSSTPLTWSAAESFGLVCLPAAGYRDGSSLLNSNTYGNYWSATPYFETRAHYLWIADYGAYGGQINVRSIGRSIRLVSIAQ